MSSSCAQQIRCVSDGDFLCNLQRLPDELIQIIFSMLPPSTLLIIQESTDERLRCLTTDIRVADFTKSENLPFQQMHMFFTSCSSFLMVLNLDHTITLKEEQLTGLIGMCSNLRSLSVKYCGLYSYSVAEILSKLNKLTDFSWDVNLLRPARRRYIAEKLNIFEKLQRLSFAVSTFHLFLWIIFRIPYCKVLVMLELDILFMHEVQRTPALASISSNINNPNSFLHLDSIILTFRYGAQIRILQMVLAALHIVNKDFAPLRKLWIRMVNCLTASSGLIDNVEIIKNSVTQFCFPGQCTRGFYDAMDKSCHDITHFGISACSLCDQTFKSLKACSGEKLRHFCVIRCSQQHWEPNKKFSMCSFDVLKTFYNITSLNLEAVHFDSPEISNPCDAICYLKGLQQLALTTCAIKRLDTQSTSARSSVSLFKKARIVARSEADQNASLIAPFVSMISSCEFVEKFQLSECDVCKGQRMQRNVSDNDLNNLLLWSKLKYLQISSIPSLRTCSFLTHVSHSCKLEYLELINVGCPAVCHFMPHVVHVLTFVKSLSFLRIINKVFNYNDTLFWKTLSNAHLLHGLCLKTESSAAVCSKLIADNIIKLKYFHVFHFEMKGQIPDTFKKMIYKNMSTKGVACANVILEDGISLQFSHRNTKNAHTSCFYHHSGHDFFI